MVPSPNKDAETINARAIRAKMADIISEEFKQLIKEQLDPWIFFNSKGVRVKKFDGKDISIAGVEFSGSPREVFWQGYIEPYIADAIERMIERTIEFARDKNVAVSAVLASTKANLSIKVDAVYGKMQEIDRRLRGKGYPESVAKEDISHKVKQMNGFLERQIRTYEDLAFQVPDSRFKKWYKENPHWVWLIGIIIGTGILGGIISTIIKLIF